MSTHEQRQRRRAKRGTGVMHYRETIVLPPQAFDVDRESVGLANLIDKMQEQGTVTDVQYAITVEAEAEDVWALRDLLDEWETYLASEGVNWMADRANMREVER